MTYEMKQSKSVDPDEIDKFAAIAGQWWDENGKFKPLHRINPLRVEYIRNQIIAHFDRNHEEKTILRSKPLNGVNILDIGCGGGLICEPMARLGANVTGIDASEKNIAVAKLHAEESVLDIKYLTDTAESLAAGGKQRQFDVVMALEILEHVADLELFVDAAATLVKPGGLLFMSTLNRTTKSFALAIVGAEYILGWLPRGTHDWNKFIKPHELHSQLRNSGLRVTDQKGMVLNPLNGKWELSAKDLSVNYLLTASKATNATS